MVQRISLADELKAADWESKGIQVCSKCGQRVQKWQSPSGTTALTNLSDHGTAPGRNHMFSCGEQVVNHELPPVPDQEQAIKSAVNKGSIFYLRSLHVG